MRKYFTLIVFAAILSAILSACSSNSSSNSINLFSIDDDINLGAQMRDEILANPNQYKIWERNKHPQAYAIIDTILGEILNSGQLKYKDQFSWEVYIIKDHSVQNAFAVPGGYIFVYTGLVQNMNSIDELAGVLAHEVAHVDLRHSTNALTREYGISFLLNLLLGEDNEMISRIVGSMISLDYSRDNEHDADKNAVKYLCNSSYKPDGIADFFSKNLDDESEMEIPEFFSTHPNSAERVQQVKTVLQNSNCSESQSSLQSFNEIKAFFN